MKRKYSRTNHTNIVRGESGTLYVRATVGGRKIFKSLQTKNLEIAVRKRNELIERERAFSSTKRTRVVDDVTLGQLYEEYLIGKEASNLRPATKELYRKIRKYFSKACPDALDNRAMDVTEIMIRDWMRIVAGKYVPQVHNHVRMQLLHVCQIGVDCGIWRNNPARPVKLIAHGKKEREFPSDEQISKLLEYLGTLRMRGSYFLCKFLCYSGFRIGTATRLKPEHVSREEGVFRVPGELLKTGKPGEIYRFPIFPKMRTLLDEMDAELGRDRERLIPINDCWMVLFNACKHLKIPMINHHGFRHVFTTNCILAGVPIPVIAQWRGDHDGGKTLLRVYFHLIDEQSKKFAAQVQMP